MDLQTASVPKDMGLWGWVLLQNDKASVCNGDMDVWELGDSWSRVSDCQVALQVPAPQKMREEDETSEPWRDWAGTEWGLAGPPSPPPPQLHHNGLMEKQPGLEPGPLGSGRCGRSGAWAASCWPARQDPAGEVIRREGRVRVQRRLGKESACSFYSIWASGLQTDALVLLIQGSD